ncbi:cytochrome P450 family 71 subfamily A polypeptide 12 [Euphorbia peplus]|nr:cytochrome P450 family 71 subfamily A polypeptide 12 [Euphorbia peplus]
MAILSLINQMNNTQFLFPLLISFIFLLLVIIVITRKRIRTRTSNKLNLPPSPPKLPIIGNLHQLGKFPHRFLRSLSIKYGPLLLFHLGHKRTLVISSAEIAKEIMTKHDIVFSDRDRTTAANIFFHGSVDIGFSPYGDYWRHVRKIGVLQLLSLKRVQAFQSVRDEEVSSLVGKICDRSSLGNPINLSAMLVVVANNIISRCALGRKAVEEDAKNKFGEVTRRMMMQFSEFCFGDMFPCLGWLDKVTGLIGRMKSTAGGIGDFLDQVIAEHRIDFKSEDSCDGEDFVHTLLHIQKNADPEAQLHQDNLKAILTDMFVAGTETISTTMEWLMAELIRDENVMRKAQQEVRRIVGNKSKVEAADIEKMNYLKCIVKETLRLHPPAPFLVPRETSADVELGGYYIPSKTTVYFNALAIQTDPKIWERSEEFVPERFENNPVDFKGKEFQLIPFGGGRRICPGISFGLAAIEFVIANILNWFDWKLPDGQVPKDLDMTENFGLTVPRKNPLYIVPLLYHPLAT